MVQLIGFMIAAYIVTRMVELLVKKDTEGVIAVFAGITILVVIVSVFGLFSAGSGIASSLGQIPH